MRHLFGRAQVGDERGRDAEAVGDDAADVDRGVAHAFDRGHDVQHARDLLRVALGPTREHAHLAHLVDELVESLLELPDFVGHALVRVEERRVAEVDHELGGVLRLREHVLQVAGFVVHRRRLGCGRSVQVIPRITMARISESAPSRSRLDVTIGTPWLSGSSPSRWVATAA